MRDAGGIEYDTPQTHILHPRAMDGKLYSPHISLCLRSSAFRTVRACIRPPSLSVMQMYGGTITLVFPRGPSISTFEPTSLLRFIRCCCCCGIDATLKVTSGGIESGARPILERGAAVVENLLATVGARREA